jgi:fermentation-respiration switch protein FrsA (DUF1100 family)
MPAPRPASARLPSPLLALALLALILAGGGCESKGGGTSVGKAQPLQLDDKAKLSATTTAQQFVASLSVNNYNRAISFFTPMMRSQLPSGTLAGTWKKVLKESGAYVKMRGTRIEVSEGYRVVFVDTEWAAATGEIKIVIDKDNKVAGLFFLPTTPKEGALLGGELPPIAPDPLLPKGLLGRVAMGGAEGWPLPGAFIFPDPASTAGKGPTPAVVFVHGSGPHDRDETIGPNKPFYELATELAKRGIASYRYTKRTKMHGKMLAGKLQFTVDDEAVDDAVAAVKLAAAQPEIDGNKVFVVGHSLGGYLLPRIGKKAAAVNVPVAGYIGLAALSRTLWDSLEDQITYLTQLEGGPYPEMFKPMLEDVKAIRKLDATNFKPDKLLLDVPSAYWLDLKSYQPLTVAAGIDAPWLFLQGGRDYQVTEADFKGWQKALRGNKQAMFRFYPNLNHLMQPGEGMATPDEYRERKGMLPSVFDDLASFIKKPR